MKEMIRLLNGNRREADVNGRSLDGKSAYAFLLPPDGGTNLTFEEYLLAGREVPVRRGVSGDWEEVDDPQTYSPTSFAQ